MMIRWQEHWEKRCAAWSQGGFYPVGNMSVIYCTYLLRHDTDIVPCWDSCRYPGLNFYNLEYVSAFRSDHTTQALHTWGASSDGLNGWIRRERGLEKYHTCAAAPHGSRLPVAAAPHTHILYHISTRVTAFSNADTTVHMQNKAPRARRKKRTHTYTSISKLADQLFQLFIEQHSIHHTTPFKMCSGDLGSQCGQGPSGFMLLPCVKMVMIMISYDYKKSIKNQRLIILKTFLEWKCLSFDWYFIEVCS